MKKLTALVLSGLALTFSSMLLAKDAFPQKPIRLVVPFSAGGGSDGLARAIQSVVESEKLLPTPIVITNAEGAGGAVGTRQVLRAAPDGYTLLQIHQEMFAASAIGRVNYSPMDFEPVIQVSETCLFLGVAQDSSLDSFESFLQAVKEKGAELKQGDDIGSATHFPSVQLMKQIGNDWTIVPVGSTSKRFTSLKGGFTDLALMSPLWLQRGEGDIRGLALLGDERSALAPDLPTAKELGYDVKACLNRRYWAPKGTSQQNIDVLADAIEKAAQSDRVRDYLEKSGEELKIVRGEQLRQEVESEYQSFLEVANLVKGDTAK